MAATTQQRQLANIVTGVVTAIIASVFAWKLNTYSENNTRIEEMLRQMELNKASTAYVDKQNDKQDAQMRRLEDNLTKQLNSIEFKLDKIIDRELDKRN